MRPSRALSLAAAAALVLALSACSSDAATDAPVVEQQSATAAPTATPEPTEEASTDAAATGTAAPEWANPVTAPGQKISTFAAGDVTVDIYQVGVTQATRTGSFVKPDTNEPIIAVGDDIVFVNYVITNSGAPIDLGSLLVEVNATYDDWPYMQGMDSITDDALFKAQGVNYGALKPGAFVDPSVYTLGTGQSISYGENFRHQPGSPITFTARVIPVDAQGELLHDLVSEGTAAGTIA